MLHKQVQDILEGTYFFLVEGLKHENLSGRVECMRKGLILQLDQLSQTFPSLNLDNNEHSKNYSAQFFAIPQNGTSRNSILSTGSATTYSSSGISNESNTGYSGDGETTHRPDPINGRAETGSIRSGSQKKISVDENSNNENSTLKEERKLSRCESANNIKNKVNSSDESERTNEILNAHEASFCAEDDNVYCENVEDVPFRFLIGKCDHHGVLSKRSKTLLGVKHSKVFRCILYGNLIYFYLKENDDRQKKVLNVHGFKIFEIDLEENRMNGKKKNFGFKLESNGRKTHLFFASKKALRDRWVTSISRAISSSFCHELSKNGAKKQVKNSAQSFDDTCSSSEDYSDEYYEELSPEDINESRKNENNSLEQLNNQISAYYTVPTETILMNLETSQSYLNEQKSKPDRSVLPETYRNHLNTLRPLPDAPKNNLNTENYYRMDEIYCEIDQSSENFNNNNTFLNGDSSKSECFNNKSSEDVKMKEIFDNSENFKKFDDNVAKSCKNLNENLNNNENVKTNDGKSKSFEDILSSPKSFSKEIFDVLKSKISQRRKTRKISEEEIEKSSEILNEILKSETHHTNHSPSQLNCYDVPSSRKVPISNYNLNQNFQVDDLRSNQSFLTLQNQINGSIDNNSYPHRLINNSISNTCTLSSNQEIFYHVPTSYPRTDSMNNLLTNRRSEMLQGSSDVPHLNDDFNDSNSIKVDMLYQVPPSNPRPVNLITNNCSSENKNIDKPVDSVSIKFDRTNSFENSIKNKDSNFNINIDEIIIFNKSDTSLSLTKDNTDVVDSCELNNDKNKDLSNNKVNMPDVADESVNHINETKRNNKEFTPIRTSLTKKSSYVKDLVAKLNESEKFVNSSQKSIKVLSGCDKKTINNESTIEDTISKMSVSEKENNLPENNSSSLVLEISSNEKEINVSEINLKEAIIKNNKNDAAVSLETETSDELESGERNSNLVEKSKKIPGTYVAKFAYVSTNHEELSFSRNDELKVVEEVDGKFKTVFRGRVGLVSKEYLRVKD